jgi:predicted DNA-binding protein with PD1-like motif
MNHRLLHESAGRRSYVVALERGEHLMACLTEFAREERCQASELTAIGALEWSRLAYFDVERREYQELPLQEQAELLSLNGRITLPKGTDPDSPEAEDAEPHLHVHAVLGHRDGSTSGGHLIEAEVRPTCEIFLTDYPTRLPRHEDPDSGLAVISLESAT